MWKGNSQRPAGLRLVTRRYSPHSYLGITALVLLALQASGRRQALVATAPCRPPVRASGGEAGLPSCALHPRLSLLCSDQTLCPSLGTGTARVTMRFARLAATQTSRLHAHTPCPGPTFALADTRLQFVLGAYAYLWPRLSLPQRMALGPLHRYLGAATWLAGLGAIATGLQEKITFMQMSKVVTGERTPAGGVRVAVRREMR